MLWAIRVGSQWFLETSSCLWIPNCRLTLSSWWWVIPSLKGSQQVWVMPVRATGWHWQAWDGRKKDRGKERQGGRSERRGREMRERKEQLGQGKTPLPQNNESSMFCSSLSPQDLALSWHSADALGLMTGKRNWLYKNWCFSGVFCGKSLPCKQTNKQTKLEGRSVRTNRGKIIQGSTKLLCTGPGSK